MKTSPFNSFSLFRRKKPQPPTGPIKIDPSQVKSTDAFQKIPPEKIEQSTRPLQTNTAQQRSEASIKKGSQSVKDLQSTSPLFDSQNYRGTRPLQEEKKRQEPATTTQPSQAPPVPPIMKKAKRPKKKNNLLKAFFISLTLILACGGTFAAGFYVLRILRQPFAPQLAITMVPTEVAPVSTPTIIPTGISTPLVEISPTPTPAGICGKTGNTIILVIADDVNYWEYPSGADAIRLVGVDFEHGKVTIFALPRDLWLLTTPLNKYDVREYKLGPAYNLIQLHEGITSTLPINGIAQIIYDNFGIAPDHYLVVHQSLFKDLVNTLGGLDISIPQPINDPQIGLYLFQGYQKLDGTTVEKYMRYLSGHSTLDEWGRFSRQNEILRSFKQAFSKPEVLTQAPKLINQFSNLFTTDLNIDSLLDLACAANTISSDEINFSQIDRANVQITSDGSMILINKQTVIDQLKSFFSK